MRRHLTPALTLVFAAATSGAVEVSVPVPPTATPRKAPVEIRKDKSAAVIAVDHAVEAPRDVATGQATGKRMHQPLRLHEESFDLADGRVFIVDRATGAIRFGDGEEGRKPPPGKVVDGAYRTGSGRTLVVKDGKLLDVRTLAPTPLRK